MRVGYPAISQENDHGTICSLATEQASRSAGHFLPLAAKRRAGPGARHNRGSSGANIASFDPRS
jgi:hypothetical protein